MRLQHSPLTAFAAFFFCFSVALAQPTTTFIAKFGVGTQGVSQDLFVLPNGDAIVAGYVEFAQIGFLARIDNLGQMIWGGKLPHGLQFRRVYKGPGDSFYACGVRDTTQTSNNRAVVGLFDGTGQNLWLRQLDGHQYHGWLEGAVLKNGNLLVGASGFVNQGSVDHLCLLDAAGNFVWERQFGDAQGLTVAAFGNGGALIGRTYSTIGFIGSSLSEIDANGNILRTDTIDMSIHDIATYHDSLIYISGATANLELLVELDSLFGVQKSLDFSNTVIPWRLSFHPDGKFGISGQWISFGAHYAGFGIFRPGAGTFGADGWTLFKGWGATEMQATPDGGYMVGFTYGANNPLVMEVEKLDNLLKNACDSMPNYFSILPYHAIHRGHSSLTATPCSTSIMVPTVSIVPDNLGFQASCLTGMPEVKARLLRVWPNPGATAFNVEWDPGTMGSAPHSLRVWSNSGKLVLTREVENDGNARLDFSSLPNGCYHIQILADGAIVGKSTIMKQ